MARPALARGRLERWGGRRGIAAGAAWLVAGLSPGARQRKVKGNRLGGLVGMFNVGGRDRGR